MLSLAIDTSSPVGTIALGNVHAVANEVAFEWSGRHSQALFPALERIGLPRLKLSRIIVGLGPGSFSGIRVALAAAQAIALTQRAQVVGICSAFATARCHPKATRLGVFADARRGQLYCTVFKEGALERETYLIDAGDLEAEMSKMTLAVTAEPKLAIPEKASPHARDLLQLPESLPQWQHGPDLEPIYLREAAVAPT